MTTKKHLLFVDDEPAFLAVIKELFAEMSNGSWEIATATSHSQALDHLKQARTDLVVIDIGMPVVDGLQFLRLLHRAHPGQQAVILTGRATEENRKACSESGSLLVLEKPAARDGFAEVFSALKALVESQAPSGFKGMMRQVGLQEVLQMECLGRKSSVLEVSSERLRGLIHIHDGMIVHAQAGAILGEAALYSLLGLKTGDFNLGPFAEPARRTIQGPWEFLLMEAARLTDEALQPGAPGAAEAEQARFAAAVDQPLFKVPPSSRPEAPAAPPAELIPEPGPELSGRVEIEEVLLCSGAGEVLHEWQCTQLTRRLQLFTRVEHQGVELSNIAGMGRFERLEIKTPADRTVVQIQMDRRLLVRSVPSAPRTP